METMLFYVIAGVVYMFSLGVRQKLKSTHSRWSRVRSVTGPLRQGDFENRRGGVHPLPPSGFGAFRTSVSRS